MCIDVVYEAVAFVAKNDKGSQSKTIIYSGWETFDGCGTIQLTINIHGLMIPTTFQVIKSLNHDMILGMTFLTNTQANIDLAKGEITLYDGLVGANLVNPEENLLRSDTVITTFTLIYRMYFFKLNTQG